MVGDGMQCPPSPLLFDPSVALDQSLRDVAEAPVDILALEEPSPPGGADRGGSAHGFPEPPAQVRTEQRPWGGLQTQHGPCCGQNFVPKAVPEPGRCHHSPCVPAGGCCVPTALGGDQSSPRLALWL